MGIRILGTKAVDQGPTRRDVIDGRFVVTSGLITVECGHCMYRSYAFERRFADIAMLAHTQNCPALGHGPRPYQMRLNFSAPYIKAVSNVG